MTSAEDIEMWNKRKVAKFLNASYDYVDDMPYDEFVRAQYLASIETNTHTEEGIEVLKNNIRYMLTEPETDKLRDKYGR